MLQKWTSITVALLLFSCNLKSENSNSNNPKTDTSISSSKDSVIQPRVLPPQVIDFVAVGDMMLGTNYPGPSTLPPNHQSLLTPAESFIKEASIAFGNCEGTFLNNGGTPKGSGANIYCFRQPENYVQDFKDAGFDFLSIANNHINDFGSTGIENTIKVLTQSEISFAGTPSHASTFVKRGDLLIGLIAFAPHTGCLDMNDIQQAVNWVKKAKSKCDILLLSFHGGAEGSGATHVTRKTEIFYGQNRGNVYDFAHKMIDAGADIIIGHGPHVARGIELYQSKLIAYSLGNFCTYGMFNLSGVSGFAPLLQFKVNEKGNFVSGKIVSFKQINEGGPIRDENQSAAQLIKKLSNEDFPDNQLIIDDNGDISIKK